MIFLRAVLLSLVFAAACRASAFPLSSLSATSDYRLYPTSLHCYSDGTCLAAANSNYPFSQLALNDQIEPGRLPSRLSETTVLARLHPRNGSVIWARAISIMQGEVSVAMDVEENVYALGIAYIPDTRVTPTSLIILKYSKKGALIWEKSYSAASFPEFAGSKISITTVVNSPALAVAGSRTLTFAGIFTNIDLGPFTNHAVFVDVETGDASQVPLPIPDSPLDFAELAASAADASSGASCYASKVRDQFAQRRQVIVQCVSKSGKGEVYSRELTMPTADTQFFGVKMVMAAGYEGAPAVLHVVTLRALNFDYSAGPGLSNAVHEMLVYKLSAETLEDLEWDTGAVAPGSTIRAVRLPTPHFEQSDSSGFLVSVKYLPNSETVAVMFSSATTLFGIEQTPTGEYEFTGDNSESGYSFPVRGWLLFFGKDPAPTAISLPQDPRPPAKQDEFNQLFVQDIEQSEDLEDIFLYGLLGMLDESKSGPPYIHPFPVPRSDIGPDPLFNSVGDSDGGSDGHELESSTEEPLEPTTESISEPTTEAFADITSFVATPVPRSVISFGNGSLKW